VSTLVRRMPWGVVGFVSLGAFGCQSPTKSPAPPTGGANFVLDYASFESAVAPVLANYGCNSMQCHGGGIRGTYELSPPDVPNLAFDFEQSRLQVNPYDPTESPLLTMPLDRDAGGFPHEWEPFETPDAEGYQTILAWILAGEFE